jgi:hypothetical protein
MFLIPHDYYCIVSQVDSGIQEEFLKQVAVKLVHCMTADIQLSYTSANLTKLIS